MYRFEAATREGFVQQIAVSYLLHGYYFYVRGVIPDDKDPAHVDQKIIERYGLSISKWARARRKRRGQASVQYLRHGRFFVLAATEGRHEFWRAEGPIRDMRKEPLECFGYCIKPYQRSNGKWHPSIRIAKSEFRKEKKWFRAHAVKLGKAELEARLHALPFAPFAPVRNQYAQLLRIINRRRKRGGLPQLSSQSIRRRRKSVCVFAHPENGESTISF